MTTKTKFPIGLMLILSLIALFAVLQMFRVYYLFGEMERVARYNSWQINWGCLYRFWCETAGEIVLPSHFPNNPPLPNPFFALLESVMLLCLSICTIVSFIKLKPNAVFLGKLFFGLLLLRSVFYPIVFSLIATIPVLVGRGGQAHWFHWVAIPLYLIGLAYLLFSKQIQNFFPKEQRTIRKMDMAIAIVAVPIVVLGVFYFRDLFGFSLWVDFFVLGIK